MDETEFQITYRKLYAFMGNVSSKLAEWQSAQLAVTQSLSELSLTVALTGVGADTMKDYMKEIYPICSTMLGMGINEYQMKLAIFLSKYLEIDTADDFVLDEATLNRYLDSIRLKKEFVSVCDNKIKEALEEVSDIYYLEHPSWGNLYSDTETLQSAIDDTIKKVEELEEEELNGPLAELEELIASVQQEITNYQSYHNSNTIYHAGDFANTPNFETLQSNLSRSISYQTDPTVQAQYTTAIGQMHTVQEHIYQEQCEARKEQGYQTIFNAAVFVVVSTGMIILSVGLATPAVVSIGSIGLSAGMVVECGVVAFFVSDTAEGIGDIYYGSIGDLESIAVNPLKQVLAGGDDEFYAREKDFFMMVVGWELGVNASMNAGASFGKAMSIELAQCAIGGIASEAVIQYAEANNWSEAERNLGVLFASTIASTLTGMGMQQIGQPRSGSSLTLGEHASIVDNIADDVVVPRVGSPELDVPESMITPIQSIDAGDVSIGRAPDIPENVATPMQGVGYVSEGGSKTGNIINNLDTNNKIGRASCRERV